VDVDDLGNVYVTGSFKGADVDFDPGDGTDLRSSAGQSDAFLSKFDSSVSYQWVRAWGGTSVDYSYNVCTDWLGNVFTAGTFYSSDMDFDPGPGSDSHSSSGWDDAYLSMFDSSGNYVMARIWGGTDYDEAYGLDVSDTGAIFVTGFFYSSSMEFAPVGAPCFEDSDIHYSLGNEDAFLVKYMPDGCW
jgi:phage-related tail fiber protein